MRTKFQLSILLLVLFFVFCHKRHSLSDKLNIGQIIRFHSFSNKLLIENTNNNTVKFKIKINDSFPLDSLNIIQNINILSDSFKISKELSAWKYISQLSYKSTNPLTHENWQHNPYLFLNSIGGGMCDDVSSILVSIWKNWYDSARVIQLNGHIVAELKVNGKWKMLDADYGIAYQDFKKELYSVQELTNQPNIILHPKKNTVVGETPYFNYLNPMTRRYAAHFNLKQSAKDITTWHLEYPKYNNNFILPSHSSMSIVHSGKNNYISVKLSKLSTGILYIPFVLYQIHGDFKYKIKNNLKKKESSQSIIMTFPKEIKVLSCQDTVELLYHINPMLDFWKSINVLKTYSTDTLILSHLFDKRADSTTIFDKECFYFEQVDRNLGKIINNWPQGNVEHIGANKISKMFQTFLDEESNFNPIEKKVKIDRFNKIYHEIEINPQMKSAFFDGYPQSLLYLFASIKDNKVYYLNKITQPEIFHQVFK